MTINSGRLDGAEGWIVREQKLLAKIERLTHELAEAKQHNEDFFVAKMKVDTALRTEIDRVSRECDALRAAVKRLKVPVCIGRPTIQALAKHGMCEFDAGLHLIAADDLNRADPYERAESAEAALETAREALKLAHGIADSWIHDQLDGTSGLAAALAELEPATKALGAK